MSSAQTQVYSQDGFADSQAQDHFSRQFDLQNPDMAKSSYQRIMHQHTKQQFEVATASSRRRSTQSSVGSTLTTERSNGSVNSTAS